MKLENKIAVVTGGSRGLGAAIAKELAANGAEIVIIYKEQAEEAEKIFSHIKKRGLLVQADLSKESEIIRISKHILEQYPAIDILVNNAGAILRPDESWQGTSETFDNTIDVNLKSAWLMTRELAQAIRKGGSIVNMSSVYGALGAAPVLAYTIAKAGINSFTRSMAKELAPNIRVNAIAPSNFDTDMTIGAGPELIQYFVDETPLKRLGKPEEVAKLALFLASDDSSYITGQIIDIDGGYSLK